MQAWEQLTKFKVDTAAGPMPFAKLQKDDIRILNYSTTLFDPTDFPGALRTDTEVCVYAEAYCSCFTQGSHLTVTSLCVCVMTQLLWPCRLQCPTVNSQSGVFEAAGSTTARSGYKTLPTTTTTTTAEAEAESH
jgi:hypothetical protein